MFDRQLAAAGNDAGAVLDLPVAWGPRSLTGNTPELMAAYQMLQMTHRRPIPYGYLSHTYAENPVPVVELMGHGRLVALGDRLVYLDLDLNGQPASAVGPQTRDALLADGFRYVVWRKDILSELEHDVPDSLTPGFIASVFPPGTKPAFDDGHTVAYRLTPTTAAERTLTVAYGDGWGEPHNTGRRAYGSGQIDVDGATAGPAELRLTAPVAAAGEPAETAHVVVTDASGASQRIALTSGATVEVPIALVDGDQHVTLSPAGSSSFRVQSIDLVTGQRSTG